MTDIVAFKGFDARLQCREFQFEIGKSFKHDGPVEACDSGFHACSYPLDVFGYYPPASSRYAEVILSGETDKKGDDTKIAAAEITVKVELHIPEIAVAAVRFIKNLATRKDGNQATGEREMVEVSGTKSVAFVTGDWSAATATGPRSAATATGPRSAATASGWRSAATATGPQSAATATGPWSAATASGPRSAATATGYQGKVRGKNGCALFLAERGDDMEIVAVWSGIVGRDGIKPDTFYILQNGQPVETE
ncbi:MAG: hypothetical protein BGP07_03165 [Rhizobiales bacterium 63-22]|nr:MAG: hypothetical protein BGP07_03165 [Rhizobiales bacterium 63-22]